MKNSLSKVVGLFVISLLLSANLGAETFRPLDIQVNFPPPFPREFSAYFNNPTAYTITVTNFSDQDQEVYFLASMKGVMNDVLITTIDNYRAGESIIIPAGETVMLTGDDVANLNEGLTQDDLIVTGIPSSELNLNGLLPEGMYQFCINAYDFNLEGQFPLSVGCGALIDIFYGDQTTILQPLEQEVIPENPAGIFTMQWDPNITDAMKRMDLEYRVKIIDLTENDYYGDLDVALREGGAQPLFDELILEEIYLYNSLGTDFELEYGHQYAMIVQAMDPFEEMLFTNDGYSEVRTFWYGEIPEPETEDEEVDPNAPIPDCVAGCEYIPDFDQTPAAEPRSFSSLEIGNFTVEDVEYTGSQSGDLVSGNGRITLPFLNIPLAVQFNQVRINPAGRIYDGDVFARDDSDETYELSDIDERLGMLDGYLPENEYTAAINQHVTSLRMLETLIGGAPVGVPIGIQETLQGHTFNIALTRAKFTEREADVDLVAFVDMTSMHPNFLLPLSVKDICLSPGGFGSEAVFSLSQNLPEAGFGGLDLTLYGSSGTTDEVRDQACYLEIDCDGLKGVAVRGNIAFPRNTVVPDDNGEVVDTGRVRGYFEFSLDRNVDPDESAYAYRGDDDVEPEGNHIMLGLTMDPFQVTGLAGWSFIVQQATMDLSDLENPEGILFPEDYANSPSVDTGLLWQGFHLKELMLLTPPQMTDQSRRSVALRDIIIDAEPSLSLRAEAANIIDVQSGNLKGWGFSLDTFQLNIVQNTLIDGRLIGKVSTPLVGSADYLNYRAILNQNEEEQYVFNAIATPDSIISLPMVIAEAGLCPNSFIQFQLSPDTTVLTTFLAGQMTIDVTNNLPESLQELDLIPELSIRLADFQLNFNTNDGFVTEEMTSTGDHSSFAFGLTLQESLCGEVYAGPFFVDTDDPDYDYNVGDMGNILQNGIQPDEGADSANSPQESVSGFPISIDDYSVDFTAGALDLRLTLGLHLSNSENNVISGSTTIGARSTIKLDGLKIKKLSLDSLWLECIYVGTEQNPIDFDFMTIWGGVCFRDYNGGKGFEGELHLGIGDNMSLDLLAGFGQYGTRDLGDFGTEDFFGWWYIDGMFRMDPGITVGPVTFNGFGGGIYWNVAAPDLTLNIDDVMGMSDGSAPMEPVSPFPNYGQRNLAFRTSLSLISPKTVIIDPEIAVSWHVEEGLQAITLNGDFWVAAMDYANRDESARLYGTSATGLTFEYGTDGKKRVAVVGMNAIYANIIPGVLFGAGPNNLLVSSAFAMGSETLFDYPDLDHSDPDDVYWFFNCGNPYEGNPGGIKFELPGFNLDDADNEGDNLGDAGSADVGAGVLFYLMTGQNVPSVLPEAPGRIEELFAVIDNHQDDGENSGGMDAQTKDDDRDNTETQTGGGLVMGAHIFASAEVNAVVYARFAILAGMDMMLFNYPANTSCITEGGTLIESIGMNGWYGSGRAYIGMEGVVGAKGKILGKEIDVRIMHLVAAAMVEAGGPNPMYLDGRVGIYYNLLNGFIEGSARLEINVGDRCQPIGGSPFGFPVIVETNPDEGGADDVSPFVRPKVSFSIPVADDPDNPAYNRIMRLRDTEDRVIERIAYIHEFEVEAVGSAPRADYSRDENYPLLIAEGRAAEYRPVEFISGTYESTGYRNWRMRVVIRAKEKLSDGSWTDIPGEFGQGVFEEVREIDFRTGPLPEQLPDSQVGITKPLRFQHFYLQDDVGYRGAEVKTRQNLSTTYFAPRSEYDQPLSYKGVVIDASTGEEIARNDLLYIPGSRTATFNLPTLENDREYELAVIRKNEALLQVLAVNYNTESTTVASEDVLAGYAEQDVSSEYAVTADVVELNSEIDLAFNETLIFKWTFRTSEYNDLNEKMSDANLSVQAQPGYHRVRIRGDFEGFDYYDIYGKTDEFDTNVEDEEQFQARSLVQIKDPVASPFFTQLANPLMGGFATTYEEDYAGEDTGVYFQFAPLNTQDINLDLSLPTLEGPGLGGGGGGNSGNNGNSNNSNNSPPIETDLTWPLAIFLEEPLNSYNYRTLNLNWTGNQPGISLNEEVEAHYLLENTANSIHESAGNANHNVYLKYYVTEHTLQDAQLMTDFYEIRRDIILNPDDYTDLSNGLTLLRAPDRRLEDIEALDEKYIDLVTSDLIRNPPPTIITARDIDEENNPPPEDDDDELLFQSGTATVATFGGGSPSMNMTGMFGGGGSNSYTATATATLLDDDDDDDGFFSVTIADRDNMWNTPISIITSIYGFSNRLQFLANRTYSTATSYGSSKMLNLNN